MNLTYEFSILSIRKHSIKLFRLDQPASLAIVREAIDQSEAADTAWSSTVSTTSWTKKTTATPSTTETRETSCPKTSFRRKDVSLATWTKTPQKDKQFSCRVRPPLHRKVVDVTVKRRKVDVAGVTITDHERDAISKNRRWLEWVAFSARRPFLSTTLRESSPTILFVTTRQNWLLSWRAIERRWNDLSYFFSRPWPTILKRRITFTPWEEKIETCSGSGEHPMESGRSSIR